MDFEKRFRPGGRGTTGREERSAAVVSSAVTAVTLSVAFGLLALGVRQFWVVFIVGFAVVLPASVAAVRARQRDRAQSVGRVERSPVAANATADADAAMAALRLRYVRGELTDAEFERRLERLLKSEASQDGAGGEPGVREPRTSRVSQGPPANR